MKVVKRIRKLFGRWLWIPLTRQYLLQERSVQLGWVHVNIPVGVFHPTLFFSSTFLLGFACKQVATQTKILELGAGSGLLSVALAKKGALVTASDINPVACTAVCENAKRNHVSIEIIESDLFDNFKKRAFDLILINPPYYPKHPETSTEMAWYCGANYEYFHKLFTQLATFIEKEGFAVMVLSEDCNIKLIGQLAIDHGYSWHEVQRKKFRFEWNYLFKLTKLTS